MVKCFYMSKLYAKGIVQKAENGEISVVVTTEGVDRSGESIPLDSWDLSNFQKSPRMFVDHDYSVRSITGIWKNPRIEGGALKMTPVFHEITDLAKATKSMVEQGFLDTTSVGFMRTKDKKGVVKNELLEVSWVGVPCNPDARVEHLMVKDIGKDEENAIEEFVKTAVPVHETPKMDEGVEWDGNKAEANIRAWASSDGSGAPETMDWEKYSKGFAWYDEANKETFGAYKLPHHDIVNGELEVNWSGVAAAMGALMGARGGVEIPDTDMQGVYNHLAEHYKQFDKEPPEMRSAEKGMIDDAIENHEMLCEQKVKYLEAMFNAFYKFCDAFMLDTVQVAQVVQMTDELCVSLKTIAETDLSGIESDDGEMMMEGMKNMQKRLFAKSGRVLSNKNRAIIQASLDAMSEATVALTDLMSATETEKGGDPEQEKSNVPEDDLKALDEIAARKRVIKLVATQLGEALNQLKMPRK